MVIASIALVLVVAVWAVAGVMLGHQRVGDGTTIESYGFDLSHLSVPRSAMTASGLSRDSIAALDDPKVVDGRDVPKLNAQQRRKVVVSSERVLGVVVNGTARAYPMRILSAHEVINDTIAGVPVAILYSPLGDTAMVVQRDIAGQTRRFGASGLLLRSTLIAYDRDAEIASLWSPLERRAIAGPLVAHELEALPGVALTSWASWLAQHPESEIIVGDPAWQRRYTSVSYTRYFGDTTLYFPVVPLPTAAELERDQLLVKSPMIALRDPRDAQRWLVVPTSTIVKAIGSAAGAGFIEIEGLRLHATLAPAATPTEPPGVILLRDDGEPLLTVPTLWFAWHAFHPETIPVAARPADETRLDQLPSQSVR